MLKPVIAGLDEAKAGTRHAFSVQGALAGLSLSMLLSSLSTSIANVALPTLAQAFDASFQQVQWILLAYLLAITTLIVTVGRLGDTIGRRRLLLGGIVLFAAASILCGAAPTLWLLIAARALQGLGAASMMALTLAFVGRYCSDGKDRPRYGAAGNDVGNRHRARSLAWRRSDSRIGLALDLSHQRAARRLGLSARLSLSAR
jgi:MFS family permease